MPTSAVPQDRRDTDGHDGKPIDLAGARLHFVGIGGCGMSGLARIVREAGAACSGTDMAGSDIIDDLRVDGIEVTLSQTAGEVPSHCDMMVISAAIGPDHPQVCEAQRRGIEVLKYSQLLGRLMIGRNGVAVAGTHGKSTTTSLLSHVLIEAGLDPTFIVGATCRQIGGGCRVGGADRPLNAEACEFDRSFHNLHPTHAVILNVEEDHLDVYRNLDEIVESFAVFARSLPSHGTLLIQHELPHRVAISDELPCVVETIGFDPQAQWRVEVVACTDADPAEFDVRATTFEVCLHHRGQRVARWINPMPGEHMAYDAAVAAVMAHRLGASWADVESAISSFQGLDRRMQTVGVRRVGDEDAVEPGDPAVTVIDDYGHHPTEIDATLRALRRHFDPDRLICVFQPHQHSRTRFLMEQFAVSFSVADIVIVPHIYFVRDSEQERHSVRAADLVDRLRKQGVQAMHLYPFGAIVEQLELIVRDGDLLVTMGAGDVWKIARDFLAADG